MKKIHLFLSFILLSLTSNLFAQHSENSRYFISNHKIQTIKEWEFRYNTLAVVYDTVLNYEFIYNNQGELLEQREEFNRDHSLFISTTYQYDKYGDLISKKVNNPFPVMDGVYVRLPLSKCETYNKLGQPTTSTRVKVNGEVEYWEYEYANELLQRIRVFLNGKLVSEHRMEYFYFR